MSLDENEELYNKRAAEKLWNLGQIKTMDDEILDAIDNLRTEVIYKSFITHIALGLIIILIIAIMLRL